MPVSIPSTSFLFPGKPVRNRQRTRKSVTGWNGMERMRQHFIAWPMDQSQSHICTEIMGKREFCDFLFLSISISSLLLVHPFIHSSSIIISCEVSQRKERFQFSILDWMGENKEFLEPEMKNKFPLRMWNCSFGTVPLNGFELDKLSSMKARPGMNNDSQERNSQPVLFVIYCPQCHLICIATTFTCLAFSLFCL